MLKVTLLTVAVFVVFMFGILLRYVWGAEDFSIMAFVLSGALITLTIQALVRWFEKDYAKQRAAD